MVDTCFALLFLTRSTSHTVGTPTPVEPLSLRGGDRLSDKGLRDLFGAAFAEMARLDEAARDRRATEFAWLGPRVIGLLLPKLHASSADERARAALILRRTTWRVFDYDPDAPPALREAAVDRWTAWYLTNRPRLKLDPTGPVIR